MSEIVKNASAGHGYHYASLADFARQKVEIPKMRVLADEFGEFIEYFDDNEWQRGARIVIPGENRAMNAAQAYGAALTYARRYTVALAQGVATDDDDAVENATWSPSAAALASEKQLAIIDKSHGADAIYSKYPRETLTKNQASQIVSQIMGGN